MLQLHVILGNQHKGWAEAFSPWLTPITTALIGAAVALSVAASQRKLTERDLDLKKRQIKKDLFDRRYSVYRETTQFIHHVVIQSIKEQPLGNDFIEKFAEARSIAPMLFHADVVEWMESVLLETGELSADKYLVRGLGGARAVITTVRMMEVVERLNELERSGVALFRPYLEFWDVQV